MKLHETEIEDIVRKARTVAVVGMQDESRADRPAYRIPMLLKKLGYKIYPVNPKIHSSLGESAFARIADLPVVPDILDVFRRVEAIPELADEILALPLDRRPKVVWLQTGIVHPEAEARLGAAGLQVVSDRCLGVEAAKLKT